MGPEQTYISLFIHLYGIWDNCHQNDNQNLTCTLDGHQNDGLDMFYGLGAALVQPKHCKITWLTGFASQGNVLETLEEKVKFKVYLSSFE